MKHLCILLLISINSVNAQTVREFEVRADYGKAQLSAEFPLDSILRVESIDYYYSQYARSEAFDQKNLDKKRLDNLERMLGGALNRSLTYLTEEGVVYNSFESARDGFHGFKLKVTMMPTKESIKQELSLIDDLLGSVESEKLSEPGMLRKDSIVEETSMGSGRPVILEDTIKCDCDFSSVINRSYTAAGLTQLYLDAQDTCGLVSYMWSGDAGVKNQIFLIEMYCFTGHNIFNHALSDQHIIDSVMYRNKHWKNMMLSVDVTGSMYSYTAQILAWLKLKSNEDKIEQIVFFNDGDNKKTDEKHVGSTGGIYFSDDNSYDMAYIKMKEAMRGGGGGDAPENNLESVISGLSICPDCEDVVMVADNWATPRDLELARKIDKPIHIILCGAWYGINVEYINLALETGGSVHTIDQDLYDLAKKKEGETVSVMGRTFEMRGGQFYEIRDVRV